MDAFQSLEDGKYFDTYFKWSLNALNSASSESIVIGRMVRNKVRLRSDLHKDKILEVLNGIDAFDFDYEPKEGDLLKIEEKYEFVSLADHPRDWVENVMFFKFETGKWTFGTYPFHFTHKELKKGKIKTAFSKQHFESENKTTTLLYAENTDPLIERIKEFKEVSGVITIDNKERTACKIMSINQKNDRVEINFVNLLPVSEINSNQDNIPKWTLQPN